MEKPKEKTPEQLFGEKISLSESKPKSKPTRASWIREPESQKNNSEDTTKYFQDILTRTPKEKLENKEISFELPSLNNLTGLKTDTKKVEPENIFKSINSTSKNIQQPASSEFVQYQQTIKSLKAELEEYKHKMESMRPEIEQYDHIINSLKSEIHQYKHGNPLGTSNEIGQFQILINSLRTELAEYKNKVELLSSERNQQNSIEALRAELAEYKKSGSTQSTTKYENMIKSLNIEISRLKNNLDSMILK
jgi:FtsZ-binding cell division protein ZapB